MTHLTSEKEHFWVSIASNNRKSFRFLLPFWNLKSYLQKVNFMNGVRKQWQLLQDLASLIILFWQVIELYVHTFYTNGWRKAPIVNFLPTIEIHRKKWPLPPRPLHISIVGKNRCITNLCSCCLPMTSWLKAFPHLKKRIIRKYKI